MRESIHSIVRSMHFGRKGLGRSRYVVGILTRNLTQQGKNRVEFALQCL